MIPGTTKSSAGLSTKLSFTSKFRVAPSARFPRIVAAGVALVVTPRLATATLFPNVKVRAEYQSTVPPRPANRCSVRTLGMTSETAAPAIVKIPEGPTATGAVPPI